MAVEIEHKYLVTDTSYREMASRVVEISQGYLCREPDRTVRVRVAGERGYLTVKGRNSGAARLEFEYAIPRDDAEAMLGLCTGRVIRKRRHIVAFGGRTWEVDEFLGDLQGLTVAEIELPAEGETYALPPFVGEEVTGDPRYYNSNL